MSFPNAATSAALLSTLSAPAREAMDILVKTYNGGRKGGASEEFVNMLGAAIVREYASEGLNLMALGALMHYMEMEAARAEDAAKGIIY